MVYRLPEPLPWAALATPLAVAEDALARLDERLATSPIRHGWAARTAFADACASLALQGDLVLLEDLVLHDAGRDRHAPSQDLTRAHAVLRTRRRIATADPGWATTPAGLAALSEDPGGPGDQEDVPPPAAPPADAADGEGDFEDVDGAFAAELAGIDALIARSSRLLADTGAVREKSPLVYDPAWGETDRLAAWRHAVADTRILPPVLAATVAYDAWTALEPLQHRAWLGPLLAADLLRARAKARHHLPALASALRRVPRDRWLSREKSSRWLAFLGAVTAGAEQGMRDHDRWMLAREVLQAKVKGRRGSSSLPRLIDLVLARPLVSTTTIADELGVTPRAAQTLVADLGLRELTGRGRYRAWGVL
ncbi:RHE_PE00001 family protein [Methylobacterium tarhaniae]|uniref:RHE_PE00001 family protein n=1 Tax=Methylobacterium tarhaniae TaxID=1187852 RepID=UPI003CFECD0E